MTREELIQSLRACSSPKSANCMNCKLFNSDCVDHCSDNLMQAAADMLEQDESILIEFAKPSLERAANVLTSVWDLLKENLAPQSEKTADEMFRELGYIYKRNKNTYSTGVYYDADGNKCEMIITAEKVVKKFCIVYDGSGKVVDWPFDFAEIRTVCKLLDEMGAE